MTVRVTITILILAAGSVALADDVGLISARLIERADHEYVIEIDVMPQMIGLLGEPILPSRFTVDGKSDYRRQGAMVAVRYVFRGDAPLAADDVLLLPWNRMGVILEARWLDGTQTGALFSRRPEGIPVTIASLRPEVKAPAEVFQEQWRDGFLGAATGLGHWLLVMSLVLLLPFRRVAASLLIFLCGLVLALVVTEITTPEIPILLGEGALLIAAFILARAACSSEVKGMGSVFIITGLVYGLAHAGGQVPVALTGFVLGTFLFQFLLAGAFAAVFALFRNFPVLRRAAAIGVGSVAVAGMINAVVVSSEAAERLEGPDRVQLVPKLSQNVARSAPGVRKLTDPYMIYLIVEAYETRIEVLVSGKSVVNHLEFPLKNGESIEIEEQDNLKKRALGFLEEKVVLRINGIAVIPNSRRADFLSLGMTGALVRTKPVPEPLETAIMGLTFVCSTPGPPDQVTLEWKGLPDGIENIPVTLTDPMGVEGAAITAEVPAISWENSFLAPEVKAVEVRSPRWAIVSAVLAVVALAFWMVYDRRRRAGRSMVLACSCTILALGLFPVVRVPVNIHRTLPDDQAADTVERLLTNVYQSFSFRDESDIYDHLAVSVTGEQLTAVYLEQRRALELENRGGARARVDRVEVTHVESVLQSESGLAITAGWNVSGSVNHFGHTHYRRNRYIAVVHVVPIEGTWKIDRIEIKDEQRVL